MSVRCAAARSAVRTRAARRRPGPLGSSSRSASALASSGLRSARSSSAGPRCLGGPGPPRRPCGGRSGQALSLALGGVSPPRRNAIARQALVRSLDASNSAPGFPLSTRSAIGRPTRQYPREREFLKARAPKRRTAQAALPGITNAAITNAAFALPHRLHPARQARPRARGHAEPAGHTGVRTTMGYLRVGVGHALPVREPQRQTVD